MAKMQGKSKVVVEVMLCFYNFGAGLTVKGLRWLEPYDGKLSRTVLRGGNTK